AERFAEPFEPQRVRHGLAAVDSHGVAVGLEDQLDRIDQGAVEIEQDCLEAHSTKKCALSPKGNGLPGRSPPRAPGAACRAGSAPAAAKRPRGSRRCAVPARTEIRIRARGGP